MSSVQQAGIAAITNQLTYDDEVGGQAMRAIYDHARSEDDRPLCLVASFIHPHDPYATRQKYWDLYEDVNISLPSVTRPGGGQPDPHNTRLENVIAADSVDITDQDIINARRAYYGNVTYVDEWLGRLQDTLEECGMDENTTVIFTSDHGDMLGEYGLWYKMSFREWSCRIPIIVYNPSKLEPRRVSQPVAHVDILPTLVDIASEGTGASKPEPIDPLDGRSLWPLCRGDDSSDPDMAVSEYLAEGTGAPMLMIRKGHYKFICCPTDPDQLFDLSLDPDEMHNLAADDNQRDRVSAFRAEVEAHWDVDELKGRIIEDQVRRRRVHEALRIGVYHGWDYNPARDPSQEYTRSHMDLTRFDITSRFPRPPAFNPKYK